MPTLPLSPNNQRIDVVLRRIDVNLLTQLANVRGADFKDYVRQILESHCAEYRAILNEK